MMLPIVLDLARVPVALIGRDAQALKRLRLLEADGVARVRIFSDTPSEALRAYAGERLVERLPSAADLAARDAQLLEPPCLTCLYAPCACPGQERASLADAA